MTWTRRNPLCLNPPQQPSGKHRSGDGFSAYLIDGAMTTSPGGHSARLKYSYIKNWGGQRPDAIHTIEPGVGPDGQCATALLIRLKVGAFLPELDTQAPRRLVRHDDAVLEHQFFLLTEGQ